MSRRAFLLLLALVAPAVASDAKPAVPRPNIIFILADDVGLGETSFTGADKFKTPNIDALAKGTPREWVYVELMGRSFVRDARWKLANDGSFFDLKEAPFNEMPVPKDTADTAALAAMKKLQSVLDEYKAAPWDGDAKPGKRTGAKKNKKTNL